MSLSRLTRLASAALIALTLAGGVSATAMAAPTDCRIRPDLCEPPPPPPSLAGDPSQDAEALLSGVADWPLWPDVQDGLRVLAGQNRVGVLSNVDDDIFARTRVAPLVDAGAVFTSEKLRSYKPPPAIYPEASRRAGPGYVHVATSARDVRGALGAGIGTIRLRRPGHTIDPEGPTPMFMAATLREVATLLPRLR